MPPANTTKQTANWIANANLIEQEPLQPKAITVPVRRLQKTVDGPWVLTDLGTKAVKQSFQNNRSGRIVNVEKLLGTEDPTEILDQVFTPGSQAFREVPDDAIWDALEKWANLPANRALDGQDATMAGRAVLLLMIRRAGGSVLSFHELPY